MIKLISRLGIEAIHVKNGNSYKFTAIITEPESGEKVQISVNNGQAGLTFDTTILDMINELVAEVETELAFKRNQKDEDDPNRVKIVD